MCKSYFEEKEGPRSMGGVFEDLPELTGLFDVYAMRAWQSTGLHSPGIPPCFAGTAAHRIAEAKQTDNIA